jgi:hypothetical protein
MEMRSCMCDDSEITFQMAFSVQDSISYLAVQWGINFAQNPQMRGPWNVVEISLLSPTQDMR